LVKGSDHWADCFSEIAAFGCVQSMGIFVSITLGVRTNLANTRKTAPEVAIRLMRRRTMGRSRNCQHPRIKASFAIDISLCSDENALAIEQSTLWM
jgi:hypothetical protein